MTSLHDLGLLGCSRCYYVWKPRYGRVPKKCPRCQAVLKAVDLRDDDLPDDFVELLNSDLTVYQRQQLLRAITLYISGNLPWALIIIDWLKGEPELDYYGSSGG